MVIGRSTHAVCLDLSDRLKITTQPKAKPVSELPSDSGQLMALGKRCLKGRLVVEAESCFIQALALDQGLTEARYWLGCLYNRQGNYEQAAMQLRSCLAAQPRNGHAYAELGLVYFKQGQVREARTLWQQGLLLSISNVPALIKLLEEMSFYVTIDGEDKVICNLCSMATLVVETAIAHSYLERAYILEPYNSLIFKTLAMVLAADGRCDDALLAWEEAIRLRPQDSYLVADAAAYYLQENQIKIAKSKAEKAVELAPNNADHRLLLAQVQGRLNNTEAAEMQLRIAHELAPEQAAVNYELGHLLWSQSKSPTGLLFLAKAMRAGYDKARQFFNENNALAKQ